MQYGGCAPSRLLEQASNGAREEASAQDLVDAVTELRDFLAKSW